MLLAQHIVNTLVAGFSLALVAVGFGLVYATARFFHFAHGAMYTIGAYAAYFLLIQLCVQPALALAIAIVIVGTLGGLLALCVFDPLRRRGASSLVMFLASLGLLVVFQNLVSMSFGDQSCALSQAPVKEGLPLFGARITPIQIITVIASVCVLTAVLFVLNMTPYGRIVRAVSNDGDLSRVVGIPTRLVIIAVFAGSAMLAATSGILAAFDTGLTPSMGFSALFMGVVAAIVGGIGSVRGAAIGSMLIAFARTVAVLYLSSQWQDAITFLILILSLLLWPRGILRGQRERIFV